MHDSVVVIRARIWQWYITCTCVKTICTQDFFVPTKESEIRSNSEVVRLLLTEETIQVVRAVLSWFEKSEL